MNNIKRPIWRLSSLAAAACAVVFIADGANAGPNVLGQMITWQDDGWFQVQDSATYESICEGGHSCLVDPGTYKVINHSTGQVWQNIVVKASGPTSDLEDPHGGYNPTTPSGVSGVYHSGGSSTQGSSGTPTVSIAPFSMGMTIYWPRENGWMQVQNKNTYASICEGMLRSCVAPSAGTYTVINHSNSKRSDVTVSSSSPINKFDYAHLAIGSATVYTGPAGKHLPAELRYAATLNKEVIPENPNTILAGQGDTSVSPEEESSVYGAVIFELSTVDDTIVGVYANGRKYTYAQWKAETAAVGEAFEFAVTLAGFKGIPKMIGRLINSWKSFIGEGSPGDDDDDDVNDDWGYDLTDGDWTDFDSNDDWDTDVNDGTWTDDSDDDDGSYDDHSDDSYDDGSDNGDWDTDLN